MEDALHDYLMSFSYWYIFSFEGKTEVGIYRLSGLNSEIQRLKKAFNKSEYA